MSNLTNEELKDLCVKNKWFQSGTNQQYQQLFELNSANSSVRDLALVIWLCTPNSDLEQIKNTINLEIKKKRSLNMACLIDNNASEKATNYYIVCMDSFLIRDAQMFDTKSLSDEEFENIDKMDYKYEGLWHDIEPEPFISVVKAESGESACKIVGLRNRYDPRALYATRIDIE